MTRLFLTPAALLLPATAMAHSGDHSQSAPTHMLSEPDHLAGLALVVALGLAIWLWHRRRS